MKDYLQKKLKELYEKEYEEEVNSRINNFVERDLNEEGKNLIKYIVLEVK